MKGIRSRIEDWKKRSLMQKAGDFIFWLLLILLIIPPSRKVIATGVNQVILHIRKPGLSSSTEPVKLSDQDYHFMLSDTEGKVFTLADFKGEVILLNLWATWCPPCLAELPGLEELYESYGDRVHFLLVTNQSKDEVVPFIEKRALNAPVFFQHAQLPSTLQASSIPTTYIISRDGKIAGRFTGAMDWNSGRTRKMLDELLSQEVLR